MSDIAYESFIKTVPSGNALGSTVSEIDVNKIVCNEIEINGTLNGEQVSGAIVFTNSTQTITNKTIISPTIATITNGIGILTLPVDVTDTLVGRDTIDTLTSKSLDGASTKIVTGSSNVGFDLSTLVADSTVTLAFAGPTRTIRIPPSPNCDFVLTETNQNINGRKNFFNLACSYFAIGSPQGSVNFYVDDPIPVAAGATDPILQFGIAPEPLFVAMDIEILLVDAAPGSSVICGTLKSSLRVVNKFDTLTMSAPYNVIQNTSSELNGISVTYSISGTILIMNLTNNSAINLVACSSVKYVSY